MATSGSSNFAATRNEIINAALRKVNAIASGETAGAQEISDAAHVLNAMVKNWQATGIHVWTVREATLFPQLDQVKYQLGNSSSDHATESYVETAISAEEASGQTTLSVTASSGMTVADNIGIVVDDGTLHWTTISSIPDSTSVVIASGIDDSAAEGNAVFAYTTKIGRPLKVVDARRYNVDSGVETPIEMISRKDYQALPNKTQEGIVNQAWYDPGRDTGYLTLWNEPADISELIKFTWHRAIEDFDAAGDNPDLPQEWISTLEWNLALELTVEYPVSEVIYRRIALKAASTLDNSMGFDREEGSVFFQPAMDGR